MSRGVVDGGGVIKHVHEPGVKGLQVVYGRTAIVINQAVGVVDDKVRGYRHGLNPNFKFQISKK